MPQIGDRQRELDRQSHMHYPAYSAREPSLVTRWASPFRRLRAVLLNAAGTVKMFFAGR
jgi:hypothetical protein